LRAEPRYKYFRAHADSELAKCRLKLMEWVLPPGGVLSLPDLAPQVPLFAIAMSVR
jgi:hypothetical protein